MEIESHNVQNFKSRPKEYYSKASKSKKLFSECSICFEPICSKRDETNLSCNHNFHSTCINQWFEKDNRCPLCRNIEFDKKDDIIKMMNENQTVEIIINFTQ